MLKIDASKEQQLTFEVQIGGVQYDQISGYFRVVLNEVEYGFPAKIGRESITVDLPQLNKIISTKIKESDEVDVRLDIIADGHYIAPWQDKASISNPLLIEAKIISNDFTPTTSIKTKLKEEDSSKKKSIEVKKIKSDDELMEHITEKLSKKLDKLIAIREQQSTENKVEEIKTIKETKNIEQLLNKTLDTFNISETKNSKSKKISLKEFKQNLTKEDVMRYIKSKSTKNPDIQNMIYEQASALATIKTPSNILKEVVKIIRKK